MIYSCDGVRGLHEPVNFVIYVEYWISKENSLRWITINGFHVSDFVLKNICIDFFQFGDHIVWKIFIFDFLVQNYMKSMQN